MNTDRLVLSNAVQAVLNDILITENFEDPKITLQSTTSGGDGFVGINIALEISEGSKILNLFIKTAPKDEKLRKVFLAGIAFKNEIHFYKTAYPTMMEFYRKKTGKVLHLVPKFYAANEAEFEEVLALENLNPKGFTTFGISKFLNKEQTELIMREYGKFHAVSFAMKDQEEELFTRITQGLPGFIYDVIESLNLPQVLESRYEILRKHWRSPDDDLLLEKLDSLPRKLKKSLSELGKYDGEYQVLTHGDCWGNNMMYRSKNNHLDLRLIDFQAIKLNSFAADLCHFFYSSAASEENLGELNTFLDIYYESLSSTIEDLGCDPGSLCPRHIVKDHWKIFSMFGLFMGSLLLAIISGLPIECGNPDVMLKPLLDDTEEELLAKEEEYARVMKPFFRHFIANGVI